MGMSIGGTKLVRCREVVGFSEGPLLVVLLNDCNLYHSIN